MPKQSKKQITALKAVEALKQKYPEAKCSLNADTPFQLLVATRLSAQCTDARVNMVTEKLFKKYQTLEDFASARYDELCEDIRSTGFFRNKAKNIILCARMLLDEYGGKVPDSMEELLRLPGTGRKTANLVLGDIFGKPAVVVDTHCIRLSKKIGLTKADTPEKIEYDLKKIIPPENQLRLCHQFVKHGRLVCTARSPKCEICDIKHICCAYKKES